MGERQSLYGKRRKNRKHIAFINELRHLVGHVTHPSYMIIDGSLRDLLSALVRLQHPSGLWHTVLTDPDSYLEVSGSAGIASLYQNSQSEESDRLYGRPFSS